MGLPSVLVVGADPECRRTLADVLGRWRSGRVFASSISVARRTKKTPPDLEGPSPADTAQGSIHGAGSSLPISDPLEGATRKSHEVMGPCAGTLIKIACNFLRFRGAGSER